MCDSLPSALPNTHSTLSATIVFPSSGTGGVIIETPSATTTIISSTTRTTTTTVPSTSRPAVTSASTTPSTFATSTFASTTRSSTTPVITSSTATTTSGAPTTVPISGSSPAITLENGQIIGISIGIAGAIALALIAIFLARRTRRRNFPDMDGAQFAPEKEQGKGKVVDRVSRVFHISPPIFRFSRPLNSQQSYNGYQNIDRSTIGVAISRPRSTATARFSKRLSKQRPATDHNAQALAKESIPQQSSRQMPDEMGRPTTAPVERPTSRLLPAKPTLTLAIPPPAATRTTSSQPPLTDRTSTLTNNTAFADLDSAAVEGTVWRPPPSDPQSATALYVADRWGNWVLSSKNNGGGSPARPEVPPIPKRAESRDFSTSKFQSPKDTTASTARSEMRQLPPNMPAQPKPAFLLVDPRTNTAIRTSSVYSQGSTARPPVRPYPPASRSNSSSNKSGKNRNIRSNSDVSTGSATTVDTEFETSFDEERDVVAQEGHLSNLSPVVERRSPSPGYATQGRSPMQNSPYQGRLDGATVRLVPPPRRPDYGMSNVPPPMRSPGFPPERTGPGIVPDTPGAYPAPLQPQRTQPRPGERTRPSPRMQQDPRAFQQAPVQQMRYQQQRQPMQAQQPPRLDTRLDEPGRYNLGPGTPQQLQMRSPHSAVTVSSTASSLLAKRLGSDRAAALAFDPNGGNRKRQPQQPWKRHDAAGGQGPPAFFLSPEEALASPLGTGMLPMTPGWQPKLTPTRRGDDLYLNVQ